MHVFRIKLNLLRFFICILVFYDVEFSGLPTTATYQRLFLAYFL